MMEYMNLDFDSDGDCVMDSTIQCLDLDGDGTMDAMLIDLGNDGTVDLVAMDCDGEMPDTIVKGMDLDGDGEEDTYAVLTDGDQRFETMDVCDADVLNEALGLPEGMSFDEMIAQIDAENGG